MGVESAIFDSAGKRSEHVVPGAYTRSYNVTSPAGISTGNHVILGQSHGGKPGELLTFGTLAEAKKTLVDGDLLKAVGYAFNASNDYPPQRVSVMRVNKGTQSTLTLKTGSTDLLKLSSWDWGVHTNKLKFMLTAGTVSNSYKASFAYKDETVVVDNIKRDAIEIYYGGSGESASCTITEDKLIVSAVDSVSMENIDHYEFDFASYDTLDAIVTALNDSETYTARVLVNDNEVSSKTLDTCSATSLSGEYVTFTSNYAAFIEAIKTVPFIGGVEELQTATRSMPDNNDKYLYFSGAIGGQANITDWVDALTVLESEDVQIISTTSTEASVQRLIKSHCIEMSSTVNRKERTCWLGGPLGMTDSAAKERAIEFNTKYGSFVCDTATATNPIDGSTEKIPGAMVAVMLAAMESGMSVNEPLTNKTLNVLAFDKKRTISNMEDLIKAGVTVCNQSPTNPEQLVCIRAITTNQSNDLIDCERSMVREDLYMNRDLRNRYTRAIGRPTEGDTDSIIQTLRDAARDWYNAGLIQKKGSENVWNISVNIRGDKTYITFARYLTAPRNFVFVTATNHVYETSQEV